MNYYKHHIGDFDRATRHLTRIERSIYRDLLDVYYDSEQSLTLDLSSLCRRVIARTDEEVTAVEQVLNEFFTKTPTGWYHDRCEEEIDAFKSSSSQKSAAGKASAAKRELKRQQALNGNPTDVEHTFNGTPTNHKPLTNNQEPLTNKTKPAKPSGLSASDLVSLGVDEQVAKDFLEVRKAKRAPLTTTALDGIKREAEKAGISLATALATCAVRGWQSFKAEWHTGQPPQQQPQQSGYKEYRPK